MQLNDEWIRWFIGGMITQAGIVIGIYIKLITRITRIETLLVLQNKNAAKAFHSPSDHHGLDQLLDKYVSNGELTMDEWIHVHVTCERVLHDTTKTPGERSLAGQLAAFVEAFANHKLRAFRKYISEKTKREKQ